MLPRRKAPYIPPTNTNKTSDILHLYLRPIFDPYPLDYYGRKTKDENVINTLKALSDILACQASNLDITFHVPLM